MANALLANALVANALVANALVANALFLLPNAPLPDALLANKKKMPSDVLTCKCSDHLIAEHTIAIGDEHKLALGPSDTRILRHPLEDLFPQQSRFRSQPKNGLFLSKTRDHCV